MGILNYIRIQRLVDTRTVNPCVGGSIPSLSTFSARIHRFGSLCSPFEWIVILMEHGVQRFRSERGRPSLVALAV